MSSGSREVLVESWRKQNEWEWFTYQSHAESRRPFVVVFV